MRFRLNFSDHRMKNQDGLMTVYRKGDIIETDTDLVKACPIYDAEKRLWKFTALDDDPVRPPAKRKDQK